MSQILFEIAILLLLILFNAVFALSEIAIVSSRQVRLEQRAKQGSRGASIALKLAQNPDRFLSTVQVGITLVGIFAGAYGGTTLSRQLETLFAPWLGAQTASTLSFIIVVGSITYLSVVVGELVPKQIALQNAEGIAAVIAQPMRWLSWLATPIVWLFAASTNAFIRLLGISQSESKIVTEEELRGLMAQSAQAGVIEEAERNMVEGVFRLGDYRLAAVLTPRPQIVWLDINASHAEMQQVVEQSEVSRYPVCDGDLDSVLGIVLAKELLTAMVHGRSPDLKELMSEPVFMPENMPAIKALETFKRTGTHLALIIDEYGGVEGVVTLYDIMEAIVGDIPTPEEIEAPRITEREDGSWLVDGLISIQDFKQYFQIEVLPKEDDYQTLGGFMVTMIGDLPQPGEHFSWGTFRFEVADMDGKRVDMVLVSRGGSIPAAS